ncbi:MAG TPA: septum site-determining protein MinD [Phycisphaerales bacterium]|nr:septum site-determining protein MinD [Phycisphaerales bacterium]
MGKVIVVTSGKGGVGKTTATANIGAGLASQGHSVVLIDTDIGLRNLDLVLGLENRIVFDLVDVVEGKCRSFRQALIKDKRFENLHILASAQSREKDAVKPAQMKKLCTELKDAFDYIILDCPAGIEMGFKNAIAGADEAIVVTNPEVSAVRDADRIVGLLEAAEIDTIRLILNRVKPGLIQRGQMLSVEDVQDILSIELLGQVPEDERIVHSSNKGEPAILDGKSRAGMAYRNIVARILDPAVPMVSPQASIWAKLRRVFTADLGAQVG